MEETIRPREWVTFLIELKYDHCWMDRNVKKIESSSNPRRLFRWQRLGEHFAPEIAGHHDHICLPLFW